MFATLLSRTTIGTDAPLIHIETHVTAGLPRFNIVGLPEASVKESKERVRSALLNSLFTFPARRITVNLAPASLRKEGGQFDLPIALGILIAMKQINTHDIHAYEFVGELGLSGELKPITGILPIAIAAEKTKRSLILPAANAQEAGLVSTLNLLPAEHLLDVTAHLAGRKSLTKWAPPPLPAHHSKNAMDVSEVQGQQQAKRTLEIAAAGGHSLLLTGPPGTGKSMLAQRFSTLLPELTETQALEVAAIRSLQRRTSTPQLFRTPPFRAPHHSSSAVALVGGGKKPQPGEISLAHHGILFLDELPEFQRPVREALREPIESGYISVSRADYQVRFPAKFQLIAAMNPCPCGYYGDKEDRCQCSPQQVTRYQSKISGPLLDRIDLHARLYRIPTADLLSQNAAHNETSQAIRKRITAARTQQLKRCGQLNAALSTAGLQQYCALNDAEKDRLSTAIDTLKLSARSVHRSLKVARTIADLAHSKEIKMPHLSEALQYRSRQVTQ